MNTHVNERIGSGAAAGAKSPTGSRPPELISATAKELLNLRRLPAMLNTAQTAALIGLAEHDIPVLVSVGLLEPLGDPPPSAVKHFATVQVMELAGEIALLSKMRNALYEHWRNKNARKSPVEARPRHARNGHY